MKVLGVFWRKLIKVVKTIAMLDSSPQKIAGSVALGVFIGSLPIPGLQLWVGLLLSIILRVNKVGTVLSMETYNNPISFPFIYYLGFKVGQILLGQSSLPINWRHFKGLNWEMVKEVAKPLFLGSVALGSLVALAAYPITLILVMRYKRGKLNK